MKFSVLSRGSFHCCDGGKTRVTCVAPTWLREGVQAGHHHVAAGPWHLICCSWLTGIGVSRALQAFVTVLFVLLWSFLQFSALLELLWLPDKCVWLWVRLSQRRVPFQRFCFGIFIAGGISTCMREFSRWNTWFQHTVEFTSVWD